MNKQETKKRIQINSEKLADLRTGTQMLSEKYGEEGTDSRKEFNARAKSWYYAELLKEARKEHGITQEELAKRIGKKREYIALLEKGETDMQLSTFLSISEALGLKFGLLQ